MIKHRFYLRKDVKSKDGLVHVFSRISYNGNQIRISVSNVKVKPTHWNSASQRIKNPTKSEPYNYCDEYNSILDDVERNVSEIRKTALIHNIKLSSEFILDRLRNPNRLNADKRHFFAVVEEYIETSRTVRTRNTLKGAISAFRFLQAFEKAKNLKLNFEQINQHLFERIRKYAFEEKEIGDNYFAKIIASLKAFMTWAHDHDYHSNLSYKRFKAPERETEVIYLTKEELFKLYNFTFETRKLNHVKDFYCFGCFTGLRFSDLINLKSSHIDGDYIVKNIQKTQEYHSKIPLSTFAKAILSKYLDSPIGPLPKISHQKFNDYIKECCRLVGIDSPTTIVRYRGGTRIETTVSKWQLITSHTARKTFVTNSLILGMKEIVVRNITGHKKEENFRRYVKIADTIKRNEMVNSWDRIEL